MYCNFGLQIFFVNLLNEINKMAFDYIFKLITLGDSGCGKTCLVYRFSTGKYTSDSEATIGVDFTSKLVQVGSDFDKTLTTVKVQLWDVAGHPSFRSIVRSYYRGTAGVLLVYDVTNRASFRNVQHWLEDIRKNCHLHIAIVLVANKVDCVQRREVSEEEGRDYAEERGIVYCETSAKTGEGVAEAFKLVIQRIYHQLNDHILEPNYDNGIKKSNVYSITLSPTDDDARYCGGWCS